MNDPREILVWAASAVLAIMYIVAGGTKVLARKESLEKQPHMAYLEGLTETQMKTIGILEVLGAVGVILPHLTGILPWLSVAAALGLALVQVAAIALHRRRGEHALTINIALLALALVVAAGLLLVP